MIFQLPPASPKTTVRRVVLKKGQATICNTEIKADAKKVEIENYELDENRMAGVTLFVYDFDELTTPSKLLAEHDLLKLKNQVPAAKV